MDEREPARWSADPSADDVSELLSGIRAARNDGPTAEQLTRMRVAVALPPVAKSSGALLKLLTGALALAIAGASYFVATRTVELPPAAPSSAAQAIVPSVSAPTVASDAVSNPATPTLEPEVAVAPRKRVAKSSAKETNEPPPAIDAELALLRPARAYVRSAPARALELVAQHERTYPHGALIEEREVIAIEALLVAARIDDGLRRAQRFFAAYPRSAHVRRVRALLEESGVAASAQE